jgi:iron complex transport system ATP-binding protein
MSGFIKLSDLVVGYKEPIIDPLNASVNLGELLILSGRNGVGKSTLLKHLSGFIPPIGGIIEINNSNLSKLSIQKRADYIAIVNNNRIEEHYITVEDLVKMGRYNHNGKIENDHFVEEAIYTMGIEPIRKKTLNKISDGEWQKTNIARALAQNTSIIILDEPSAFLDYPSKIQLFENLKNISKNQNKLIIASTHDLEIAKKFGTLFWHVNEGKIDQFQSPMPELNW